MAWFCGAQNPDSQDKVKDTDKRWQCSLFTVAVFRYHDTCACRFRSDYLRYCYDKTSSDYDRSLQRLPIFTIPNFASPLRPSAKTSGLGSRRCLTKEIQDVIVAQHCLQFCIHLPSIGALGSWGFEPGTCLRIWDSQGLEFRTAMPHRDMFLPSGDDRGAV